MEQYFKRQKIWILAVAIIFSWLAAGTAKAWLVGETVVFNLDQNFDAAGRSEATATLQFVGDRAIYYVDKNWWQSLSLVDLAARKEEISKLLVEFDQIIYPRLTKAYGAEWSPGIDNELRLNILLTPLKKTAGGFFNTADEFYKKQIPRSNEREMIYLNTEYLNTPSAKVFLAHEFTHLINFYQKEKLRNSVEEIWLNEARAEYSATLCGYDSEYIGSNLERRVNDFKRNPTDSLTEWTNQTADYGVANIFMQYLAGRYGEGFLSRTMKTELVGIASVNQALTEAGSIERFNDIFINWLVATWVNDCQFGEGQKYCYLSSALINTNFQVAPQMRNWLAAGEGTEFSFSDNLKDWSGRWYEILPLGSGYNLLISFKGDSAGSFQAPILITKKDDTQALRFLKLDNAQSGSDLIFNFGSEVRSVVLMATSRVKQAGFYGSELAYNFSYTARLTSASALAASEAKVSSLPAETPPPSATVKPDWASGTLVRVRHDNKVYVINGQYRRWLQSPEIFNAYPHFNWQNILEVSQIELDFYPEVFLVRAVDDHRVYEINGDGTKHWLNMSAEQFSNSGRKWERVSVINQTERDWYRTGAEVRI